MHACKITEYVLHAKETVKDTEMKRMGQALIVPAHTKTKLGGLHSRQ